ncbi:MAG: rRNA maturation RNase YbeY [Phycisphaerae bacterium]
MPKKNITSLSGIKINICTNCEAVDFDKRRIINLIRQAAEHFNLKKAQINIAIVDDERIININRRFLDKSSTTDVISFDVSDETDKEKFFDIAVNAQMAARQAKTRGHDGQAELALYVLHGLLHHLGFDDITVRQAAKMHRTEDDILKKFGFGAVYDAEKR